MKVKSVAQRSFSIREQFKTQPFLLIVDSLKKAYQIFSNRLSFLTEVSSMSDMTYFREKGNYLVQTITVIWKQISQMRSSCSLKY